MIKQRKVVGYSNPTMRLTSNVSFHKLFDPEGIIEIKVGALLRDPSLFLIKTPCPVKGLSEFHNVFQTFDLPRFDRLLFYDRFIINLVGISDTGKPKLSYRYATDAEWNSFVNGSDCTNNPLVEVNSINFYLAGIPSPHVIRDRFADMPKNNDNIKSDPNYKLREDTFIAKAKYKYVEDSLNQAVLKTSYAPIETNKKPWFKKMILDFFR